MTVRRLPLALSLSCALLALSSTAATAQSSLGELSAVQSVQIASPGVPAISPATRDAMNPTLPSNLNSAVSPQLGSPATVGVPGAPLGSAPIVVPGSPAISVPSSLHSLSGDVGKVHSALGDHDLTLPPVSSDVQRLLDAQGDPDESTLLRVVGKGQARLSLMDLAGKIEEDRIKIDTNRLDFAKKKRDAANDNGSATEGSGGASGTQGGSVAGVAPVTALPPPFQPSVRSIFSFGSSSVAQVFVAPGQSIPVHAGDELPDGTKVLAVSENTVTVHKKNARHSSVLARATTVDGGPAVTALLSTAPQAAQAQAGVVQSAAPQAAPVPPAPKPPGQQ